MILTEQIGLLAAVALAASCASDSSSLLDYLQMGSLQMVCSADWVGCCQQVRQMKTFPSLWKGQIESCLWKSQLAWWESDDGIQNDL